MVGRAEGVLGDQLQAIWRGCSPGVLEILLSINVVTDFGNHGNSP